MRFFALIFIMGLCFSKSYSQKKTYFQLTFKPQYNSQILALDTVQYLLPNNKDSVSFSKLRFYVSALQFYKNDKLVFAEKNSYHLIDIENSKTLQINIAKPLNVTFNNIKFNLGIDSATNAKGAMGKDLDPTKGMYWAWHSGYINMKIEGKSKVCATRNNVFQFHLGGYQSPNNSLQTINYKLCNNVNATIPFDVFNFISTINLAITNEIMTPSILAVELSKKAATMFFN
jgi:hypothetical protein